MVTNISIQMIFTFTDMVVVSEHLEGKVAVILC